MDVRSALGPQPLQGGATSPFGISRDAWQNVQSYATRVAALDTQSVTLLSGRIPAIPGLQVDCLRWKAHTFAGILSLARATYSYAAAVPGVSASLKTFLEQAEQGVDRPGNLARFNASMGDLITRCTSLQAAAASLLPDVRSLANNSRLASTALAQLGGPGGLLSALMATILSPGGDPADIARYDQAIHRAADLMSYVGPALSSAGSADIVATIERGAGGWSAIGSDLEDLRQWVAQQISLLQPLEFEIAVDSAVAEWASIATEMHNFIDFESQLASQ